MFRVEKGRPSAVLLGKLRSLFLGIPDIVYRESISIAVIPDIFYRESILGLYRWIPASANDYRGKL
jgi:hypothetical protein